MPNDVLQRGGLTLGAQARLAYEPLAFEFPVRYNFESYYRFETQGGREAALDLLSIFARVLTINLESVRNENRILASVARAGTEFRNQLLPVTAAASLAVSPSWSVAGVCWAQESREETKDGPTLDYARLALLSSGQQGSAGENTKKRLAGLEILVPDPADVAGYLDSHADLAAIVPSVCKEARKEFGKDAELTLLVYRDPEIDDRHLSLYVRLPSYDERILTRMDRVTQRFDEELSRASGYLVFTTDLCSPRAQHDV